MARSRTAPREAFIYGLTDPRETDFVSSLRYVGQTSVGPSRPASHFRVEEALRNDSNNHKANWVRQLKRANLLPEVVVLERVDVAEDLDQLQIDLDAAERRLIAFFREEGSLLVNVQEGGASGYVLSEAEKQKISDARSWSPKQRTLDEVDVGVVLGSWSSERAWWLGLTFARTRIRDEPGRRTVEFTTESVELAEKWRAISGATSKRILFRQGCWHVDQGDVRTARWLIERYKLHLAWTEGLSWPLDLPEEFACDFIRGLWDVKGHMEFKPRSGRQPIMRTGAESASWLQGLAEAVALRLEGATVYKGPTSRRGLQCWGVAARGAATSPFLLKLYEKASDPICSSAQRTRALTVCDQWRALIKSCKLCGEQARVGGDTCQSCERRKWVGKQCACGDEKIVAGGLCRACYQAHWMRSRKGWGTDPMRLKELQSFDVLGWSFLSEEEKSKRLERLCTLYREKGFPWFVLEETSVEGVREAVSRGKLTVEGEEIRSVSQVGQSLCLRFHGHRYRAAYRGNPSVVEAFEEDKHLIKAIRFQLDHGDPVTPKRLLRALSALFKGPTNFPPTLSRWISETYAPAGGFVFDPCLGYGGRLLGVLASTGEFRYGGLDVEPRTVQGNAKLSEELGVSNRCSLKVGNALTAEWPTCDLVFTGPPYFDRESYGELADKVASRFASVSDWMDGFFGVLVEKAMLAAPTAVFNIGTIQRRGVRHDLPAMATDKIAKLGFRVEKSWRWILPSFGPSSREERLIVIRR
jgi:hypothetical protein